MHCVHVSVFNAYVDQVITRLSQLCDNVMATYYSCQCIITVHTCNSIASGRYKTV